MIMVAILATTPVAIPTVVVMDNPVATEVAMETSTGIQDTLQAMDMVAADKGEIACLTLVPV
jgi:hypothetical protein